DTVRPKITPLHRLFVAAVIDNIGNPEAFGFRVEQRVAGWRQQPGHPAQNGDKQHDQRNAPSAFHASSMPTCGAKAREEWRLGTGTRIFSRPKTFNVQRSTLSVERLMFLTRFN